MNDKIIFKPESCDSCSFYCEDETLCNHEDVCVPQIDDPNDIPLWCPLYKQERIEYELMLLKLKIEISIKKQERFNGVFY